MTESAPITASPNPETETLARQWIDLAQPRLGAAMIACSDDFFAPMDRMISPEPPVFIPGKYDDNGKWMDGWESRRKRGPGNDWAILRLCRRARIAAIDIDTSFFTGNYAPAATIEAWAGEGDHGPDDAGWTEVVPRVELQGDSHRIVNVASDEAWTHLKVTIHPDGGIARLRVFGEIDIDWTPVPDGEEIDLAAMLWGGKAVAWNDAHYGSPANLLAPGRGVNMGDGWETARRRGPGNDWCILALGHAGEIARIEIDTAHFKGNFPNHFTLRGASVSDPSGNLEGLSAEWPILVPETRLSADNILEVPAVAIGAVTHVRLDIFPDGGVSRLRLFGKIAR